MNQFMLADLEINYFKDMVNYIGKMTHIIVDNLIKARNLGLEDLFMLMAMHMY